jgi:hypothetical protein
MLSIACQDARSVSKGALSGPSLGRPLARGSDEQCGRSSGAAGPLDARTGKIASLLLTVVAQASVLSRDPAIMRRASHRVLTHRTHPTTRRLSRPPCPPSRDDPASRRADVRGCDSDRRGRNLPSLGLAGGSHRWAIRWAKPCRIGQYQAERRARSRASIWRDLQVFRPLEAPRTPCFTRERPVVRNHPRPSEKVTISWHFVAVVVRPQCGRDSACRPSPLAWPATDRRCADLPSVVS